MTYGFNITDIINASGAVTTSYVTQWSSETLIVALLIVITISQVVLVSMMLIRELRIAKER